MNRLAAAFLFPLALSSCAGLASVGPQIPGLVGQADSTINSIILQKATDLHNLVVALQQIQASQGMVVSMTPPPVIGTTMTGMPMPVTPAPDPVQPPPAPTAPAQPPVVTPPPAGGGPIVTPNSFVTPNFHRRSARTQTIGAPFDLQILFGPDGHLKPINL